MDLFESSIRSLGQRKIEEDSPHPRWDSLYYSSEEMYSAVTDMALGKPGFGKTMLCSTLVRHFKFHGGSYHSTTGNPSIFAFYFFDRRYPASVTPVAALRAIVAQLLHTCRDDEKVIDIASVAYYQESIGQLSASQEELCSILSLFLQHLRSVTLLVDGIDECSDQREFFRVLQVVTTSRSVSSRLESSDNGTKLSTREIYCSVALFSRPSVQVPLAVDESSLILSLDQEHNREDLESYVAPRIEDLVERGLMPYDRNPRSVSNRIVQNASGMFLWAFLFLEYLQSDALIMEDRARALEDSIHFRRLEYLYSVILQSLSRRYPERAGNRVAALLTWVAYARTPLTVLELQYCVSGRSRNGARDLLPRFRQTLGSLSGALVEIAPNDTVRFIHNSVVDYFECLVGRSLLDDPRHSTIRHLVLDRRQGELLLANSCLEYLNVDVPCGPLSGSPEVTPSVAAQKIRFPLLEYVLHFWVAHVSKLLRLEFLTDDCTRNYDVVAPLLKHIDDLIDTKERVTTWVEACWLFGHLDGLGRLPEVVSSISTSSNIQERFRHTAARIAERLQALQLDLGELKRSWRKVMLETPNEIWEPSVPAFTESKYWVKGNMCKVDVAINGSHDGSILILSQVSRDGLGLSQIRLFPPR